MTASRSRQELSVFEGRPLARGLGRCCSQVEEGLGSQEPRPPTGTARMAGRVRGATPSPRRGPLSHWLLGPPSSGQPQATAMASSTVDLPDPFSPAKKVTPSSNASASMARTAARDHGHALRSKSRDLRRRFRARPRGQACHQQQGRPHHRARHPTRNRAGIRPRGRYCPAGRSVYRAASALSGHPAAALGAHRRQAAPVRPTRDYVRLRGPEVAHPSGQSVRDLLPFLGVRWPSLGNDFWELESGEERHAAAPETFRRHLPAKAVIERRAV